VHACMGNSADCIDNRSLARTPNHTHFTLCCCGNVMHGMHTGKMS
jgi:hypothetical protein